MVLHLQGDAVVSTGTGNLGVSVEKRPFLKRNFVSCDNLFLWNLTSRGRRQYCFTVPHKFEKVNKLLDNIPYLKLGAGGRGHCLAHQWEMSFLWQLTGEARKESYSGVDSAFIYIYIYTSTFIYIYICLYKKNYVYISRIIKHSVWEFIPWVYPQVH